MDIPADDYEVAQAPPPKPKRAPSPTKEQPTCTMAESIQNTLQGDDIAACLEWVKTKYGESFLANVRPVEHFKYTTDTIIKSWKTSRDSIARWGNVAIPTLDCDPITVGDLHAHLSEILAAHPDFASIPIHHEECHGNVETGSVEFIVEEGILVLS